MARSDVSRSCQSVLSQHESVIVRDAARGTSFFEVNVWGTLFMEFGSAWKGTECQGSTCPLFSATCCSSSATQPLPSVLGYSGLVDIEVSLSPILGVKWFNTWQGYIPAGSGSELDDEVTFVVPTTSEALLANPDGVAMECFVTFSFL